jgi:hypothetical protein
MDNYFLILFVNLHNHIIFVAVSSNLCVFWPFFLGSVLLLKTKSRCLGIRSGATLLLAEDSIALGAGTDLLLRYEDVWPRELSTRAILETDEHSPRKFNERKLVREFQQLSPSQAPTPTKITTPAEEIVQWLKDNGLDEGAYEIFTDGSWTDQTPWLQHLFHGPNSKDNSASASIVCLHIGEER